MNPIGTLSVLCVHSILSSVDAAAAELRLACCLHVCTLVQFSSVLALLFLFPLSPSLARI